MIDVYSMALYPTFSPDQFTWRNEDFNANKLVKALKGKPVNGYADLTLNGSRRHLENSNATDAIAWFGEWGAEIVAELEDFEDQEIELIPFPSSDRTVNNQVDDPPLRLARAVASALETDDAVSNALAFSQAMQSARSGGTRDPAEIYRSLVVVRRPSRTKRVILIDDVVTSGGHLRAAAARLREHGANVTIALCGASTTMVPVGDLFATTSRRLEDFRP